MHQAPTTFGRRTFLVAVGAGVAGLAGGAAWLELGRKHVSATTLGQWIVERGKAYVVGHRGSSDVLPEHTMQAYEGAYGWGAGANELSTRYDADGALICFHVRNHDRLTP